MVFANTCGVHKNYIDFNTRNTTNLYCNAQRTSISLLFPSQYSMAPSWNCNIPRSYEICICPHSFSTVPQQTPSMHTLCRPWTRVSKVTLCQHPTCYRYFIATARQWSNTGGAWERWCGLGRLCLKHHLLFYPKNEPIILYKLPDIPVLFPFLHSTGAIISHNWPTRVFSNLQSPCTVYYCTVHCVCVCALCVHCNLSSACNSFICYNSHFEYQILLMNTT